MFRFAPLQLLVEKRIQSRKKRYKPSEDIKQSYAETELRLYSEVFQLSEYNYNMLGEPKVDIPRNMAKSVESLNE